MAVIEHGGNAVKAETVKLELLKPIFAVGKQEVDDIVLTIVKAERVPRRMFATAVAIEILVIRAVKASETLDLVFHSVTVHDVHNHRDAELMGTVDEALEFLRSAETARRRVETRHMIAK